MYNDGGNRYGRDGAKDRRFGGNNMRGPARKTYPMEGNAPRVGRTANNVPKAQRFGEERDDSRSYDGNFERRGYDKKPAYREERGYDKKPAYREERGFEKKPAYREERSFEKKMPYGSEQYYHGDPKRKNGAPRPHALPPKAQPVEDIVEAPMAEEFENLLCGRNPIREALKAGRPVEKLLVASGDLSGTAREIVQLAKEAGVIVQNVDRSRLDQIYPAHQGMLAYVAAVPYSTVDEMLEDAARKGEDPFLIILDGITDPHNLGAIVRSAECVGAHGVIVPERRAVGLTPAAAKAAAGALNHMKIARVTNLNRAIDELKERGVWIIGTAMDGENAFTADLTGAVALVIGSEGDGISRLTLEKCDRRVTLPMKGHIESLNASVAAGVMMYEIARARSL